MSRYLGRALKVHLKLHNSVRTTNQNYCSISYSITSDCYNKKYKRSDLLGSVCSGQLQSRNFSFQSIGELNASIYNFVVASEPSIALKYALISFHDTTGLPWWSTIILTTAMVKWGIGLPLQICQVFFPRKKIILSKFNYVKINYM